MTETRIASAPPLQGDGSALLSEALAVSAEGLWRAFGLRWALRDLSLGIPTGCLAVLFGPNGSGKSTLVRVLAGILAPHQGRALVHGRDIVGEGKEARRLVGVATHNPYLYDELTAFENLQLFAGLYGVPDSDERARDLLCLFNLNELAGVRAGLLSRGMRQRLALARAFLHSPPVLLLDEPDSGLDPHGLVLLEEAVTGLHSARETVLITTHDLELGLRLGDFVGILHRGALAYWAPTASMGLAELKEAYEEVTQGGVRRQVSRTLPALAGVGILPSAKPGGGRFAGQLWSLFRKDLMQERRARETLPGLIVFALAALMVFSFAFPPERFADAAWGAGALWVSLVFAGVLAFGRAFSTERDRGTLEGLLAAPLDRSALFLAKLGSGYCLLLVLVAIALPLFGAAFNLPVLRPQVVATVVFGCFALAAVMTLTSALAAGARAREFLLPVLSLPLAVPVIIAATAATADAMSPAGQLSSVPWAGLLAAFAAIVLAVGILVFERVVEE